MSRMEKKSIRNWHTTLGYFYVGLIVSFALSGVMMNHRSVWQPQKYTVSTQSVTLPQAMLKADFNEKNAYRLIAQLGVEDKVRRFVVKKNELRIMCVNNDLEVNLSNGKGELTTYRKTPIVGHIIDLHKTNSNWWIYYSDIFGISLVIIALTGVLLIPKQQVLRRRAIILMVSGVVFPLLFLLFLAH